MKPIDPYNKILRHGEALAKIQRGERVWPVNVELDISNACNLRCSWCAFAYMHNGIFMEPALFSRIMEELDGIKSITFTGGGEPTIHPDFAQMVQEASRYKLGLYTNGVSIKNLLPVAHLFEWIYVSLDEVDKESYRRSKGASAFDTVLRNTRQLAQEVFVGLGFLVHEKNYEYIDKMVELGKKVDADYVHVHPIVADVSYHWIPDALEILEYDWGYPLFYSEKRFWDLYYYWVGSWSRGYSICRGSELVPCIGADGTVWVCPNMRGKRPLGNLQEETFAEIWARREVQKVGPDCRIACRNHALNTVLEYACTPQLHEDFV